MSPKNLFDKIFCDSSGHIVITQWPNISFSVFIAAELLSLIFSSGVIHTIAKYLAIFFLTWWSFQELLTGVNYFRRVLGAVILVGTILANV